MLGEQSITKCGITPNPATLNRPPWSNDQKQQTRVDESRYRNSDKYSVVANYMNRSQDKKVRDDAPWKRQNHTCSEPSESFARIQHRLPHAERDDQQVSERNYVLQ